MKWLQTERLTKTDWIDAVQCGENYILFNLQADKFLQYYEKMNCVCPREMTFTAWTYIHLNQCHVCITA